jgi:hypothetical protein
MISRLLPGILLILVICSCEKKIEELTDTSISPFFVTKVSVNDSNKNLSITIHLKNGEFTFEVYNILGKMIYSKDVSVHNMGNWDGDTTLFYNANSLDEGKYYTRFTDGKFKKMTVFEIKKNDAL